MKEIIVTIGLCIFCIAGFAQHDHHQVEKAKPVQPQKKQGSEQKPAKENKPAQKTEHHQHTAKADTVPTDTGSHTMSHNFSRSLPMNRNGSGTSWLPDNSPVYAYMKHGRKGWNHMIMGNLFIRATAQNFNHPGKRSSNQADIPSWIMLMTQKDIGRNGLFSLSSMLSADVLTIGGEGYPLLFQTGETFQGRPLVDSQHPHDVLGLLMFGYTHRITKDIDMYLSIGYPGEPAIGPTAFMHRISSLSNPDAPLSHHRQDATHTTFGTITKGFRYKQFKLEGSIFNGREPDENRWIPDQLKLDSYSGRISYNPIKSMSFKISRAFINSPEAIHPEDDEIRTTFSLMQSRNLLNVEFNTAFVMSINKVHGRSSRSLLFENAMNRNKHMVYTRSEILEKTGEELGLYNLADISAPLAIHASTLGYCYTFLKRASTDFSIGAQLTANISISEILRTYYGLHPLSGQVYIRVTPSQLNKTKSPGIRLD